MRENGWRAALHELIELRLGAMQPAQYIAVMSGIRRSMDDWIPAPKFEVFRKVARRLGFTIEIDCVFSPVSPAERPFGFQYAPTTNAHGRSFSFAEKNQFQLHDEIHVILAQRSDWAAETLALAWYPVVLRNRVIYKPLVDAYRLGLAFGYPECCVKAFLEHNDWPRQNMIAEAIKASERVCWQANCLAKNTAEMLIFHMPCAFDCQSTVAYSNALMKQVRAFDIHFAENVEAKLRQVVLVLNERVSFVLIGAVNLGGGRIGYRGIESLRGYFRVEDPLYEPCLRLLRQGEELTVLDGSLIITKTNSVAGVIETSCDRGIAEVPLILDFTVG